MKNKILAFGVAFATVLLPVSIILILNVFGENEFDVPVLTSINPDCDSNSLFEFLEDENPGVVPNRINLIVLASKQDLQSVIGDLQRIHENIGKLELLSYFLIGTNLDFQQLPSYVTYVNLSNGISQEFECSITFSENQQYNKTLLVDDLGKVRGQYSSEDIEELDRIVVEIKIIDSNLKSNK